MYIAALTPAQLVINRAYAVGEPWVASVQLSNEHRQ